jgi:hypothetical protein
VNVSADYLTAIVGLNASVLIAVAVDWRSAVEHARGDWNKGQARAFAVLALGFAVAAALVSLWCLLTESTWPRPVIGLVTGGITVLAVASLIFLFFSEVAARANLALGNAQAGNTSPVS